MDFRDSPEEAAFRAEVRDFIAREVPAELRGARRAAGAGFELFSSGQQAALDRWRRKLAERGWVAPAWPREYGGGGMTAFQQSIFHLELAEARVPAVPSGIGIGMAGPTLIVHGDDEQKQAYLPGILSGEVQWCQLWSEPGAGSDLASLRTSAVRDGDSYVVNGQKIWTSAAQKAQMAILLARTDPEAPKHRGITFFVVDMKTPGITVQPLTQIPGSERYQQVLTGNAGFNQVFLDNVRVPAKNIVGGVDRGWYVNTTTLDFERSSIGSSVGTKHAVLDLARFAREAAADGPSVLARNPLVRYELADRLVEAQTAVMLSLRVAHMQNKGLVPNHEASIIKLFSSELGQRLARTEMKLVGLYGQLLGERAPQGGRAAAAYVGSLSATIAGGTSEIQRNIIAQRGLAMPRD
jgi:alkylation response protein AidB-like acyl-CoA dehydrogenase